MRVRIEQTMGLGVLCTSTLCIRGGMHRLWALGVLCTSTLCKRGGMKQTMGPGCLVYQYTM